MVMVGVLGLELGVWDIDRFVFACLLGVFTGCPVRFALILVVGLGCCWRENCQRPRESLIYKNRFQPQPGTESGTLFNLLTHLIHSPLNFDPFLNQVE